MSTFNGIIHEFPDIRIDFFRGFQSQPPLACFLSHIHSDHLAGLDRLRSPFVYCSAATREILLRLEKYPCRLNYAKGIFEDPRMQTYKHLAKVLKPIPLDTPTEVELEPGKSIQVTLLDANHCAGAVMFLIEGNGRAVLYTGDIRSEPWWVNSIARNPSIIEYSSGLKTLDRIYLDTSMLDDFPLQTKAEGLHELLEKIARYPKDTCFFMQAWTYGYEEVWVALSKALNSKIHVDKYKMGVYKSLATKPKDSRFAAQTHLIKEAPYLVGFTCGNNQREGCLTLYENVRIHSCEKGTSCAVGTKPIVWIKPIVAHLKDGRDMVEVGIGGGGDDLAQKPSLEAEDIVSLIDLIERNDQLLGELGTEVKRILQKARVTSRDIEIDMDVSEFTEKESITEIFKSVVKKVNAIHNPVKKLEKNNQSSTLSNRIIFPYARHSSLPELRHLVKTFKPKDIWPCTVDPADWIQKGITMRGLFGDLCTENIFEHDRMIDQIQELQREPQGEVEERESQPETQPAAALFSSSPIIPPAEVPQPREPTMGKAIQPSVSPPPHSKRDYDSFQNGQEPSIKSTSSSEGEFLSEDSQASALSDHAYDTRLRAFRAAQANMEGDGPWNTINLISTTDNHSTLDPEL
ncbi:Metallo-hydrolase/oxidoreductase [Annulohypoxylon maeteangense]|uniref:Metallo-hydrolase/oxidoreductase n=1 Tax=Annulohypoxylon maeteangense TaxID=1927788 RepID=UPI0020084C67|nr:Metallo-hydrolase/oxidoreductase [Annulohypoxylon maeteangense]KAI0888119.1 Metallo-hydrolase/oxidoreductase [Annulohypoxylon maeteangense]